MGSHSINNLYPVINYLRVNLKYILTKSIENAKSIDQSFLNSTGTNNIETVLKDDEISGIFICTQAKAHFDLVKKALQANKNVFVEKPPCLTSEALDELIEVEKASKGTCLVGFQKQYAPCNLKLKNQVENKCTYNYRFITGAYPEGDPFLDLFIHPIALIIFLFGRVRSQHILVKYSKNSTTVFLQLTHENKTVGAVELSTDYSWKNAMEKLIVNTSKGVYEITNTEELTFNPKSGSFFKIPKEKLFDNKQSIITLNQRNSFNPVLQNNQLYSSGYFAEIKNFVDICESNRGINNSTLSSCIGVYQVLTKIKNKVHVQ